MSGDSQFGQLRIPFSSFYFYQLMARKHGLEIVDFMFDPDCLARIRFSFEGTSENQEACHNDMGIREWYEDNILEAMSNEPAGRN